MKYYSKWTTSNNLPRIIVLLSSSVTKVDPKHVDLLVKEFELDKYTATNILRKNKHDLKQSILYCLNNWYLNIKKKNYFMASATEKLVFSSIKTALKSQFYASLEDDAFPWRGRGWNWRHGMLLFMLFAAVLSSIEFRYY